jgi:hypothetical protein
LNTLILIFYKDNMMPSNKQKRTKIRKEGLQEAGGSTPLVDKGFCQIQVTLQYYEADKDSNAFAADLKPEDVKTRSCSLSFTFDQVKPFIQFGKGFSSENQINIFDRPDGQSSLLTTYAEYVKAYLKEEVFEGYKVIFKSAENCAGIETSASEPLVSVDLKTFKPASHKFTAVTDLFETFFKRNQQKVLDQEKAQAQAQARAKAKEQAKEVKAQKKAKAQAAAAARAKAVKAEKEAKAQAAAAVQAKAAQVRFVALQEALKKQEEQREAARLLRSDIEQLSAEQRKVFNLTNVKKMSPSLSRNEQVRQRIKVYYPQHVFYREKIIGMLEEPILLIASGGVPGDGFDEDILGLRSYFTQVKQEFNFFSQGFKKEWKQFIREVLNKPKEKFNKSRKHSPPNSESSSASPPPLVPEVDGAGAGAFPHICTRVGGDEAPSAFLRLDRRSALLGQAQITSLQCAPFASSDDKRHNPKTFRQTDPDLSRAPGSPVPGFRAPGSFKL